MKNMIHSCHQHSIFDGTSRRSFLKTAMFGLGAAFFVPTFLRANTPIFGHTENLLLSCMDYRLVNDIEKYMDGRSLAEEYDHIVLAGASLGALGEVMVGGEAKSVWKQTFSEHLTVAKSLHQIHKVIVMDHWDCGAYKATFGDDLYQDEKKAIQMHSKKLHAISVDIKKQYPELEFEGLLMDLEGKVTQLEGEKH